MGYQYNRNSVSKKPKDGYEANRVSGKDYADMRANQSQGQEKHFELAEVVDVIRTSEHPDYKTNEDIGKVKVRRLYSEFDQDKKTLGYATPLNGKFKSYPIVHELVLVASFNDLPFYLRTVNWRSNPNQNTATGISVDKVGSDDEEFYSEASSGIPQSSGGTVDFENFEVSEKIKPLRHRAGDAAFEGRFGNSIRLGRDGKFNPIMQFRVGQRKEVKDKKYLTPFFEDINKDPTSIYLTDKETEFPLDPDGTSEPIKPATVDFDKHLNSSENPPDSYDGAQILMATDRVVINAKNKQIMGFSAKDTNWVTLEDFTVDAKKRIKTFSSSGNLHTSKSYHDILPEGNVHIKTESENEPVARGQETHDRLVKMLQTLIQETHPTPVGPSSPPVQSSKYQKILQKVKQTVRSEKVFVDEKGESTSLPPSPSSE